jgi:probable addiction module antidote protein
MPQRPSLSVSSGAVEDLNIALSQENVANFQEILVRLASSVEGITALAENTGIRRETLWRYGSGETEAQLKNILKILSAIGLRLSVTP